MTLLYRSFLFFSAGLFGYWYYNKQKSQTELDPNGFSNFAAPSYYNLVRLGIYPKSHAKMSYEIQTRHDYAKFERFINLKQLIAPNVAFQKGLFPEEYITRYEKQYNVVLPLEPDSSTSTSSLSSLPSSPQSEQSNL